MKNLLGNQQSFHGKRPNWNELPIHIAVRGRLVCEMRGDTIVGFCSYVEADGWNHFSVVCKEPLPPKFIKQKAFLHRQNGRKNNGQKLSLNGVIADTNQICNINSNVQKLIRITCKMFCNVHWDGNLEIEQEDFVNGNICCRENYSYTS